MSFRQPKSRKHVPLPIAGHTLVEIDKMPVISLMFASPEGMRSELRLQYDVILSGLDGGAAVITATRPGPSFDNDVAYGALSPLLDKVVRSAVAHANGALEITFHEGYALQVQPENYEAWHFQQPAPSTKPPHHVDEVRLTGYGGGLI